MIILGIDPGIAAMGWGIVKTPKTGTKKGKKRIKYIAHGVIKTPSDESASKRLWTIKCGIDRLIKEHNVDEVGVERIVFNINRKTAIIVAKAHGAVLVAAGKNDVPVEEYNALKAKRILTGDGRADKKTVQLAVKRELRLKKHPTPVHAADALAMALCHILDNDGC